MSETRDSRDAALFLQLVLGISLGWNPVDIRAAGGRTFRIVDGATGAVIGDVDEARAYR